MRFKLTIITLFSITLIACSKDKLSTTNKVKDQVTKDEANSELHSLVNPGDSTYVGCWKDSREENINDSGLKVYRRCDFKEFPASRFRYKMELNNDYSCRWLYLSPVDRHVMKPGTWNFDEKTKTLNIVDENSLMVKSFIIVSIDNNQLLIKR